MRRLNEYRIFFIQFYLCIHSCFIGFGSFIPFVLRNWWRKEKERERVKKKKEKSALTKSEHRMGNLEHLADEKPSLNSLHKNKSLLNKKKSNDIHWNFLYSVHKIRTELSKLVMALRSAVWLSFFYSTTINRFDFLFLFRFSHANWKFNFNDPCKCLIFFFLVRRIKRNSFPNSTNNSIEMK